LENKILLAVSDNAANIKKAIKEDLKWRHFGCLAHTINLIVQDALKSIEPLIVEKAKALVSHFKE
jgi:DNA-binding transcriptional regulator PaaX